MAHRHGALPKGTLKILIPFESYLTFVQAEKLEPTNPVYTSNLSAAFFEMGNYTNCAAAILRSCSHLDFEAQASLASRLSLRLARCLIQAFAAGKPVETQGLESQVARIEQAGPAEALDWSQWRSMASNPDAARATEEARDRLLNLPILKQVPYPSYEYFAVSHDDILSILENCSITDRPNMPGRDSIDLAGLPVKQLSSLAFLYGGIGDARHVFGTLIDLHQRVRLERLNQKQQNALKVHITLLDIKEHSLARDLLVLFFLSKISNCSDATEKLELQTAILYLYAAPFIPEYCRQRQVNEISVVAQETHDEFSGSGSSLFPNFSLGSIWTIELLLPSSRSSNFGLHFHRSQPHPFGLNTRIPGTDLPFSLWDEGEVYQEIKVFLPPVELQNRHPGFASLMQPNSSRRSAADHVKTSWVVNPTLFVRFILRSTLIPNTPSQDNPTDIYIDGFNVDTLGTARQLAKFHKRCPVTPFKIIHGSLAFGYVAGFFDCVIAAIAGLKEKLTLDFVHGDLQQELLRMRTYPARRLDANLPVKYVKMWLSNVPDYINGPLGTALFVVPSLRDHLGCRAVYMTPFDVTILSPVLLPRPNPELASREDLKTWLIRIFLCTLINGKKATTKILTPTTIVTFVHLLIHLHKVGYPGHWLADFLQNLLSNNPVTNLLPYTDVLPISPRHDWTQDREDARLQLGPWIPDMEAIVARVAPALPFALALPNSFPALQDIGTFTARLYCRHETSAPDPVAALLFFNPAKVRLQEVRDWQEYLLAALRGNATGKGPHIYLVLSTAALAWSWEGMGSVSWRMSRARVTRMKTEGWGVVVYGTYEHEIMSSTAPVNTWKEIN
ncbi:hypothetical protein C8R46DRAFT_1308885 [Mycena filopes]|nr:hypothetical protein C8R46DRAFT_1308885 [Mycena filopes]